MILFCTGLLFLTLALSAANAEAAGEAVSAASSRTEVQAGSGLPSAVLQQGDNEACLACHNQPGQQFELPSGEILYISVYPATFDRSVHGSNNIACTDCHTDITGYPHPPILAQTRREYTLEQRQVCAACHQEAYDAKVNDAHTLAIEGGNLNAAVCSDCHGAHDITSPDNPRSRIPQTCQRCHSQIFDLYKTSVHGSDLLGAGNPDVPSCVDCHNAHNVQGPTNSQFRLFSPQICARCHANEELMAKYDINTDVFDTYVSDFHGTTVTLYQAVTPGQTPDQPVCIDCHGVHNIARTDDPNSAVIKENLLRTCQRCHPGATPNFPAAWLSHYPVSRESAPLVFYARLFYTILIPTLVGAMAIFVAGDIGRRFYKRREEKRDE